MSVWSTRNKTFSLSKRNGTYSRPLLQILAVQGVKNFYAMRMGWVNTPEIAELESFFAGKGGRFVPSTTMFFYDFRGLFFGLCVAVWGVYVAREIILVSVFVRFRARVANVGFGH